MKKLMFLLFISASFIGCKKDSSTSSNFDLPIVVEDTTAEFNVLFYGNTCMNCLYAHFNLYVDDMYLGKVFDSGTNEDCSCDNNPSGLRAIIAPGVHTYKASPSCGEINNGEVVDSDSAGISAKGSFEVPEDGCVSVCISTY